jgi:peptide/nickel transport system substrate-binding protein
VKKLYKIFLLVIVTVMLMVMLGGCSNATPAATLAASETSTSTTKDTLNYAIKSNISTLDPHKAGDLTTLGILYNIYDPLVRADSTGKIIPHLATSWSVSTDALEYTFTLRDGVKWHNGAAMSAGDIVFSIQRAMSTPNMTSKTNMIQSVVSNSNNQVTITLKNPYGPFLANLTQVYMMNKAATEAAGTDISESVGTAPFKFVSFTSGSKLALTRFDDYWGDKAKLTNLNIFIIMDATTRAMDIQAGQMDMTHYLDPADYATIKANNKLVLEYGPTRMLYYLLMNNKVEPFDNLKVRQAIAYAIDPEAMNLATFDGTGTPAKQLITSASFGFSDAYSFPSNDLEKAKQLMVEAGYPNGFDATILCTDGPWKLISQTLQAELLPLNINLKLDVVDMGTLGTILISGDYQMATYGWTDLVGDADNVMRQLLSTETQGSGNLSYYSNPAYDALVNKAKSSADSAERLDLYKQALQIATQDSPIIPVAWLPCGIGYLSNLKGITFSPLITFDFSKAYFD